MKSKQKKLLRPVGVRFSKLERTLLEELSLKEDRSVSSLIRRAVHKAYFSKQKSAEQN